MRRWALVILCGLWAVGGGARGEGSVGRSVQEASAGGAVSYDRLLRASGEPGNWLMHSGTYSAQRYSLLDQIDRGNVEHLRLKWVYQTDASNTVEASPLGADGVMFVTAPPSTVAALDAASGDLFWRYEHPLPESLALCCGELTAAWRFLATCSTSAPWTPTCWRWTARPGR